MTPHGLEAPFTHTKRGWVYAGHAEQRAQWQLSVRCAGEDAQGTMLIYSQQHHLPGLSLGVLRVLEVPSRFLPSASSRWCQLRVRVPSSHLRDTRSFPQGSCLLLAPPLSTPISRGQL